MGFPYKDIDVLISFFKGSKDVKGALKAVYNVLDYLVTVFKPEDMATVRGVHNFAGITKEVIVRELEAYKEVKDEVTVKAVDWRKLVELLVQIIPLILKG